MEFLTIAHAQMNHHVPQFGHCNQVTADILQNRLMYCVSKRYVISTVTLPIHTSGDGGAFTLSPWESDFYMAISWVRSMLGL